jgi:hypothetical protein
VIPGRKKEKNTGRKELARDFSSRKDNFVLKCGGVYTAFRCFDLRWAIHMGGLF